MIENQKSLLTIARGFSSTVGSSSCYQQKSATEIGEEPFPLAAH